MFFDLLVPISRRDVPGLRELRYHPQVKWHSDLDDTELLDLHHQASLLLLPMNDSGANTAVVEALACGLPVVTTDVGGIRDYGGGCIYPIVPNNCDDAMIGLVEQYLSKPDWRDQIAQRSRKFAEETLAWPLLAKKHLEVYRELVA